MSPRATPKTATRAPQKAKKNIVWLASYPKSGNTWTRAFLINYLLNTEQPVPINQIHRLGIGDAVVNAYRMVSKGPFDPEDPAAATRLRPLVLRGITGNGADMNFVKTHAINDTALGEALIPDPVTRMAVYILRNPLDVALSYARHYATTVDGAIDALARPDHTTKGSKQSMVQFLGTWSDHVGSWVDRAPFPVHVMRYEDMIADPKTAFSGLIQALGIPGDDDRLARAIRHSSFSELKAQEDRAGFVERARDGQSFFHTGTAGQWESGMTDSQVARMREAHGAVMDRFGYTK